MSNPALPPDAARKAAFEAWAVRDLLCPGASVRWDDLWNDGGPYAVWPDADDDSTRTDLQNEWAAWQAALAAQGVTREERSEGRRVALIDAYDFLCIRGYPEAASALKENVR